MKNILFILLAFTVATVIVVTTSSSNLKKQLITANSPKNVNGFVVMELFTSQGCSSCPPADELLGKYAAQNNPNIIPLSFHVDYWNRLGWKDSFSTSDYSERQQEYAKSFSKSAVYTPQVIINGTVEMVGSDKDKVDLAVTKAIAQTPITTISIDSNEITGDKISVKYAVTGNIANSNIVALLVQNKASTKIRAGENNGEMLTSYNVVRSIITAPAKMKDTCSLSIPLHISTKELSIVLFIQNNTSLKITGAVKKML